MVKTSNLQRVLVHWRSFVLVLAPIVLLFIPLNDNTDKSRCAYVFLLMAIYWMTEALPLAITSLMPVFLFPIMGIMSTDAICVTYLKETNMMFLGGLMVAIAVENCNLHKRIALNVLMVVGTSPRMLMLGFMLTTMFLSMWINNTATTAMMVPIVEAVFEEINKNETQTENKLSNNVENNHDNSTSTDSLPAIGMSVKTETKFNSVDDLVPGERGRVRSVSVISVTTYKVSKHQKNVRTSLYLGMAYASNIGGTGTLIGNTPNIIFFGYLQQYYGNASGINFATFMGFAVPGMLLCVFIAWIWLQLLFLRGKGGASTKENQAAVKNVMKRSYDELGPMSFHEKVILVLFIFLIIMWMFRNPQFITGWSSWFPNAAVQDASAVILVVFLMFCAPAKLNFWCFRDPNDPTPEGPGPSALNWPVIAEKMPWDVILLLGGGFALAEGAQVSGLATWLGEQMVVFRTLPPVAISLVITFLTAMITEVASNTACATIMMPVLANLASSIEVNPLFLMLPSAVACSYAFMLPIATPPNAIVYYSGNMTTSEMALPGLAMNIICILVVTLMINTLGTAMFDLGTFPDWARLGTTLVQNGTLVNSTIAALNRTV